MQVAWRHFAAVALAATAVLKLAGVATRNAALAGIDPATGLPVMVLTALVALAELAIAAVLVCSRRRQLGAALVVFFALGALFYRAWFLPAQGPCPCLGGLGGGSSWWSAHERPLLLGLLVWLFVTALGVWVHSQLHEAQSVPSR